MSTDFDVEFRFRRKAFKDAAAGLKFAAKQLEADWRGAASVLSDELKDFLNEVAAEIAGRHSRPWPGGTSGKTLSKRSGSLVASILDSVRVEGKGFTTIKAYIGVASPGQVHETGATIRPKKSKFLAIPLPAALNSKGLPKKRSPRQWANTFVATSRAGNLIIFQRRASQIVPLYVLKTEVRIPPRLGMQKTLEQAIPRFVERAADELVKAVMKVGNDG